MDDQTTLPRDEFSAALRSVTGNPGLTKTTSRVDIEAFTGGLTTWTIDTFRGPGFACAFIQRASADGLVRLVLPVPVMAALDRQKATATRHARRRGARQAVATKRAEGQQVGNVEALRKARSARRKHKGQ